MKQEKALKQSRIVLVAGSSGSGKSTFAKALTESLSAEQCSLISMDSYYRDISHLSKEERDLQNFDHPKAIEFELLVDHVRVLLQGEGVNPPHYDFAAHGRMGTEALVEPREVVVIDGIHALYWKELRQLASLKIFIDTPLELCLSRRMERDQRERGRTRDSVIAQWNSTVEPMYHEHVGITKQFADLMLSGEDLDQSLSSALDALQKRRVA